MNPAGSIPCTPKEEATLCTAACRRRTPRAPRRRTPGTARTPSPACPRRGGGSAPRLPSCPRSPGSALPAHPPTAGPVPPDHVFFQSHQRSPLAAGRVPELGLRRQQVVDGLEGSPGGGSSPAVLSAAVWLDVHPNSPHRCHGARAPALGRLGPRSRTLGHAPSPFPLARVPRQRPGAALPGRGGCPAAPEPLGRQRGAPAHAPPLPPGSTQPPAPRHAPPGPRAGAEAIIDAAAGPCRLGLSGP